MFVFGKKFCDKFGENLVEIRNYLQTDNCNCIMRFAEEIMVNI